MSKEVLLIFQDCPYCKPREKWGERQMKLAADHNIAVKETKYNSPGAAGLIEKAHNHGIMTLPFFTDGVKFGQDLSLFIPKRVQAPKSEENLSEEKAEKVTTTAKRSTRKKVAEIMETEEDEVNGQN